MILTFLAAVAGAITPAPAAQTDVGVGPTSICARDGELLLICGAERSEDLVNLPETTWVIVTRYGAGIALADARDKRLFKLFPSRTAKVAINHPTYPECRMPVTSDGEPLRVLGLAARKNGRGRFDV